MPAPVATSMRCVVNSFFLLVVNVVGWTLLCVPACAGMDSPVVTVVDAVVVDVILGPGMHSLVPSYAVNGTVLCSCCCGHFPWTFLVRMRL